MSPSSSRSTDSTAPSQGAQDGDALRRPARRHRRVTAAATAPEPAAPARRHETTVTAPASTAAEDGSPLTTVEPAEAAQSADSAAAEPEVAADAAVEAPASDVPEDATETDAAAVADDSGDEPDAEEEDAAEDLEQRLPAASLLFQAPDPALARRRRRKVTVGTTTPVKAPQAEPEKTSAPRAQDDDAAAGSERRSASARESSAESAPRRRRRRATAASTEPAHVEEARPARRRRGDAAVEAQDAVVAEDAQTESRSGEEDGEKEAGNGRRKRRRGGRGRRARSRADERVDAGEQPADPADTSDATSSDSADEAASEAAEASVGSSRRRRRRSRSRSDSARDVRDEITALKGSTRLEAKRQRRREGRAAGRRRPIITEAEFLARRESVDRQMVVREQDGLNQIAVLEDGLLVEHYVARHTQTSLVGNVYVGRVQNVLPSMEAAFVDIGKGRNAVLYAGEVNWDAAGMEGKPRRIEDALSSGDTVLVQVTKDPIGHKGARLTSQITLAGRYLVLVPGGTMTGISRKLPDTERNRLKKILKRIVPDDAGVIVRTAAEGAGEEQLADDIKRLVSQWESIEKKSSQVLKGSGKAPVLLKEEPELAVRVVRDVFNEDFRKLIVQGPDAWKTISTYVGDLSPELTDRLEHWVSPEDVFTAHRIDEQLAKGFDRKVWLPSGGTLIIDRTEAMTVIDVNTGRFTGGADGTLEETITRNNLEAAEEIVRQLRLRDIGGMVVIDFVDMVLESNRDLVLRRLVECLGRDRTRHQVTEVTSLGLVQMTRKRVGQGLVEAFSTPCECCGGRGFIVHEHPVENQAVDMSASAQRGNSSGRGRRGEGGSKPATKTGAKSATKSAKSSGRGAKAPKESEEKGRDEAARSAVRGALAQIAAAAEHAHEHAQPEEGGSQAPEGAVAAGQEAVGDPAQTQS
ncbi:Rne/Rng family ribonuclease [Actinomyces procaprae]|uniref:Rne/Rng family ribonuclease n=1 Tax=Actinomyces procaprae TaxID=2560010 RepID=UPI0010A29B36|nr:Rne/Rng family ribonuclease [Actinomyces procaprae]